MTHFNRHCSLRLHLRALAVLAAALCAYFSGLPQAHAVPSFSRKYKTSCVTCHTVFPKLNPFGEAFRRNGYRFPSQGGSVDSDNIQAQMLPLGQDAYKKMFPNSVWPDSINQAVPLAVAVNAGTSVNLPNSAAHDAAGNTFDWNGFVGEAAIFGAGAFNDTLTYFTEISMGEDGVEVEHAYLLWNDIAGPRHAFNLSIGRLSPTLTSWGMHSSYLADTLLPDISVGMLYNDAAPEGSSPMALGHPDGLELNGVVRHRLDYSLGWTGSGASDGVPTPTSQTVYGHIGFKLGGMSLDGEGPAGAQVANTQKPWSETALTLDVFGLHSLTSLDNGTSVDPATPATQDDFVTLLGGTARLDLSSFSLVGGLIYEGHSRPYAGTAAAAGPPPVPGTPDVNSGHALIQFDELDYVVFPWLVPALRAEFTNVSLDPANGGGSANLLRIQPGVAMLVRPNIKVALLGDIERTTGTPPSQSWDGAGGMIEGQANGQSSTEAEQITANVSWAF